jgi:SAM-dependent methyltransferase
MQWARVVMNAETDKLIRRLGPADMDALEISGTYWERLGWKSYRSVQFPEFDLTKDVLADRFDVILAEQVLEHVTHPYRAVGNVRKMLRPRGWFLVTTPFMIRLHAGVDCTRWTAKGMRYFLEECGFGRIKVGAWGNRECVVANLESWMRYQPEAHSLENDSKLPVVVWALAQKRVADRTAAASRSRARSSERAGQAGVN